MQSQQVFNKLPTCSVSVCLFVNLFGNENFVIIPRTYRLNNGKRVITAIRTIAIFKF